MGSQSLCCSFHSLKITPPFSKAYVPTSEVLGRDKRLRLSNKAKSYPVSGLRWVSKESPLPKVKRVFRVCVLNSDSTGEPQVPAKGNAGVSGLNYNVVEPFRGKAGSISFYGITHQSVEASKLVSSPFKGDGGSLLWLLAPAVLILSLIAPPLFVSSAVDAALGDVTLADLITCISCEALFYIGIAIFVLITDRVQRPYLQFSPKRWGLITGLKGHLLALFLSTSLKIVAPVAVACITWPILGSQAILAVTPLLVGFAAQFSLESFVDKRGLSCWPTVPIIFEVYRLYQLTKAAHFVDGLMFVMRGAPVTPQVMERNGALIAMVVTFQAVALVCLWSLLTFLLRLFPSRPVAENY